MKFFNKILALVLILLTIFVLASCDESESVNNDDSKQDDKKDEIVVTETSNSIKAAMESNNQLTWANTFLAEDGTIITLGADKRKKEVMTYAQLGNVKKLIKGAGLSTFALTDSGELYLEDQKIAENVTTAAYCTTNVNVEGFCVINNELKRLNSYQQLDSNSLNHMFKNYPSEEKLSGEVVFIEADKHDFIVLNDEGKFFAYWTSEAYNTLDFTGFEGLVIIDIAKHMGEMGSGVVESLTVAGIKADGTPVATGTYAQDILSWGKLADIAMSDGMIVGLTEDGKVKMTGDFAEKMRETVESWSNIVAIEAGYVIGSNVNNIITALDADGTFHYVNIMNEYSDIDTGSASVNGATENSYFHKYTPDGKEYYSDYDGSWVENIY